MSSWRFCPRPKILLLYNRTCANALRTLHRFVLAGFFTVVLLIHYWKYNVYTTYDWDFCCFSASIPVRPTDHTYVLWRRGGGEAVLASVANWKCGGLAQGSWKIYESHIEGQHWPLTQSLPWGLWPWLLLWCFLCVCSPVLLVCTILKWGIYMLSSFLYHLHVLSRPLSNLV